MWNSQDSASARYREWPAATYRRLARSDDLISFPVRFKQTDIMISAECDLRPLADQLVHDARQQIEGYIEAHPDFLSSYVPVAPNALAPPVVGAMLEASRHSGVGPMAAVAGAIAEYVGRGLMRESEEVIVENGGDIFLRSGRRRELAILAEHSELLGLRIALPASVDGLGVATSAGTIGHSVSLGRADAVMIVADSAAMADAAATAVGNLVHTADDLQKLLTRARELDARGVVALADGHLAVWGEIELLG